MVCPTISKDLLEYLQGVFPDKLPETPYADLQSWGLLVGQQKVIKHLQAQYKAQNKGPLPDVL